MTTRLAPLLLLALLVGCGDGESREPTCRDDGTCEVGQDCKEGPDCATGVCGGVCLQPCADEQACPQGQGCRIFETQDVAATVCSPIEAVAGDFGDPCVDAAACRGGVCLEGSCTELCTECVPGAACVPATLGAVEVGVCEWIGARPVQTLGPIDLTVDGSEEISIEIPDGLTSFSIIVRDANPGSERRVGIASLVAPDGTVLDNGDLDYSDPNPSAIRYPDATTVFVPISDVAETPAGGTYMLTARRWDIDREAEDPFIPAAGSVLVDVVYEWADEPGGLLDLNVFVAPAVGIPPRVDDEFLTAVLDVVESKFADAGIALGNVTPASMPEAYDTVASSDEVRELCRDLSQPGVYGSAINLFLVDRLEFAYGFTGGTPSPPGQFGLASSGVVVDVGNDPGQTGVVVAHELGHFLGLGHTTAFNGDGSVFGTDAVSDTPECAEGASPCPDEPNLMYPTIDFSETNDLTAGQLSVIGRSPLLYEFVRPDRCAEWPARDVTITRRAAGLLPDEDRTQGTCGGASGERVHLLRLAEAGTFTFTATGGAETVWVRAASCDGEEIACGTIELTADLEPGDYYVFVDGSEAYRLDVDGP